MEVKCIENNLLIGSCKEELTMSYTKQTWATGDVITTDKMNHMEDGIASNESSSNTLVVTVIDDSEQERSVLDKTWQEIYDAFSTRNVVLVQEGLKRSLMQIYMVTGSSYVAEFYNDFIFYADTANDYPSSQWD